MKKVFLFSCLFVLAILHSCTRECDDRFDEEDLLNYHGNNIAGKQLVSKIKERDPRIFELNKVLPPSTKELLFNHTLFGQGFGFGIHYAIPVRNVNTGKVEGCLIYQVNKESSEKLDLKGNVDAPLFVDAEKYKMMPTAQQSCLMFFKQWKEQGLEVESELYTPKQSTLEDVKKLQMYSSINSYYPAKIMYWLDLGGYLPDGVDAYAIGLEKRREIFRRNSRSLDTPHTLRAPEIIVEMDQLEIVLSIYKGMLDQSSFVKTLKRYMSACDNDFRNHLGSPQLTYYIISVTSGSGSSGGTGSGGTGSIPGGGSGSWNVITHHEILKKLGVVLNLHDNDLDILVKANDFCDNLLLGNQFASKAYYHAMKTSSNLSETAARDRFKRHLKEMFISYFYKKDNRPLDAIYQLGIAIHGITDSFCPGHKGFQYYSLANFSEHAEKDKGGLSPEQVNYSISTIEKIYIALNKTNATEAAIVTAINIWEQAYNKNLNENK